MKQHIYPIIIIVLLFAVIAMAYPVAKGGLCIGCKLRGFYVDTDGCGSTETPGPPATESGEGYTTRLMEVTAYCPCQKCCGCWADGRFANNHFVSFPAIAAPSEYAFGTKMFIPGYGMAEVKDRGGAIKGDKLDLLFPTHQEALDWGRQTLEVKIYMTKARLEE